MSLEVVPVASKADREAWLRLPWRLYQNDPAWVPNLLMLQREVIDEKKNPFFEHGEAQLFLAKRNGQPVGRISAQVDRLHNERHNETTGFFGFFEAVDDAAVTEALLSTAEAWLRERHMTVARGPFNFSINEEIGLLVEGFEHPPQIATTHSLPYYGGLIEAAEYSKAMDLYSYRWEITDPPPRMMEAVEKTKGVKGLRVRKVDMLHLQREVEVLLDIFNETWRVNWGFVEATRQEARKMVADLRLIADPRIVLLAEIDGEPAGMIVGLPNLYEAIRDFRGFMNPINAVKLLWRLKIRGVESGRIILFGVKRKFRTRELVGLPFLLLYELYRASKTRRYQWCEESWVLETNSRLNAIMPYWNAYVYKRHRIYEKAL